MAEKIIVKNPYKIDRNRYCRELENGNILFFPSIPFSFPQEEIEFLLNQRQGRSKGRKNIAYKPKEDRISNHDGDLESKERLKEILRSFSQQSAQFLTGLLEPYSKEWKLDYASFRPFQEKGRDLRLRARNDLLHVDAFPTRPLHGNRILRFFININPTECRDWITTEPFASLAKKFGGKNGVPFPKSVGYSFYDRIERKTKLMLRSLGVKTPLRSPYDSFMLKMHNFLKENTDFQKHCKKDSWSFPPHSAWAVFTDQVSHAALAGQYALEQTFLIPVSALLYPEQSPLRVLERLSSRNMIDPAFV
jgi:hypothetical protein